MNGIRWSVRAQCMTWRVNFVRSKDAQKQLARTSLKLINKITVFSMTCSPLQVTDGYLSNFNDSIHPNDPINGVKLQFVEDF